MAVAPVKGYIRTIAIVKSWGHNRSRVAVVSFPVAVVNVGRRQKMILKEHFLGLAGASGGQQ